MLTRELVVNESMRSAKLSGGDMEAMKREALAKLAAFHPLLPHVITVKIVVNQRRNFINIRVRRELLATKMHVARGSFHFFYVFSDCFEPYINVHIVDTAALGDVTSTRQLTEEACNALLSATEEFKKANNVHNEKYKCTLSGSPKEFSSLEEALALMRGKDFPFTMQIRVATGMYCDNMPIMALFRADKGDLWGRARQLFEACARNDRDQLLEVDAFARNITERDRCALKSNFLTTVFVARKLDTCFEFHLSDKFEPYVIIIAFGPRTQNLVQLTRLQTEALRQAIEEFVAQNQIAEPPRFHYTTWAERKETDEFAGVKSETKAHSTVFHLKLRVSDEFYSRKLWAASCAFSAPLTCAA